jgi:hypothetical protein
MNRNVVTRMLPCLQGAPEESQAFETSGFAKTNHMDVFVGVSLTNNLLAGQFDSGKKIYIIIIIIYFFRVRTKLKNRMRN